MSCGCNGFDGEATEFSNVVTDGLDWVGEDSNRFLENDEEFSNFGGNGYTNFVDDFETDEFDNFLTKKMRARRQRRKELQKGGLTKKEARKKALEEIPRDKLKQVIANLKQGREGGEGLGQEIAGAVAGADLSEVTTALTNQGGLNVTTQVTDDGTQAGFFQKNKTAVIGLVVVAVVVGGYFAYQKFGKGKN